MATNYLQLADKSSDAFYNSLAENPKEFYVFVPDSPDSETGSWIREDYFDSLPTNAWIQTMNALEPYQPQMMSAGGIFSPEAKARRTAKRDTRLERKQARTENVKTGGGIGGRILDTVSGIFGGGATSPVQNRDLELPAYDLTVGSQQPTKQWYENPLVIGGGALLLLGGIYLATKKK